MKVTRHKYLLPFPIVAGNRGELADDPACASAEGALSPALLFMPVLAQCLQDSACDGCAQLWSMHTAERTICRSVAIFGEPEGFLGHMLEPELAVGSSKQVCGW